MHSVRHGCSNAITMLTLSFECSSLSDEGYKRGVAEKTSVCFFLTLAAFFQQGDACWMPQTNPNSSRRSEGREWGLRRSSDPQTYTEGQSMRRAHVHNPLSPPPPNPHSQNHNPKVHPPSLLNLALAATSRLISSCVKRSCPAQFALLVRLLNR